MFANVYTIVFLQYIPDTHIIILNQFVTCDKN